MDEHHPESAAFAATASVLYSAIRITGFPGAVTDLIAGQVERSPERIAITWRGGDPWTYRELLDKADTIARCLLDLGVTRGELVGMYMPRRPEMVAAAIGIMRAGAAYVPLEPALPDQRFSYMADHTRMRHLLVWREDDVPAVLKSKASLFALAGFDPQSTQAVTLPALTGEDLAYILYTSGTTGQPKGIRTLHRNLVNDLLSLRQEPGISEDDVFGAFTTLAFDPSVHEIFLPLLVGARIVIATEAEQDDPLEASALMREQPMTLLESSPFTLRKMLAADRVHELRGTKLWVGGEALPRDLSEAILPNCDELWNMYGPTETTVESTMYQVTRGAGPMPIGKPIANTTIYLLDDARSLVALGEIGEIWIGGAGVADGYLHDPKKTAESFVPDPFTADGSRMYRTGDLGSIRDGLLYFHGRADDQINLHGVRIEPGEIESAALAEAGIHQAVAIAREVDGDLCLILYVVADPDPDLITQLRVSLRTNLPALMLPRYVVRLHALPATPNGKVDRKALPLPKLPTVDVATTAGSRTAMTTSSVQTGQDRSWSTLVPIQPRGNRPPLFLIHGVDGKVLDYVPLARGLGADQPVYGIQAIGLDGLAAPIESITTMAACHVAEIQRIQPHGPYFLGGHSMGGLVAFEMAQQLRQQGESVALLALIDTPAPGYQPTGRTPGYRESPFAGLGRAIDALRVRWARATGRALPSGLRFREIERVHSRAMLDYRAQTYAGRVVLLRTSMASPDSDDAATLGWKHAIPNGIEVVELPGNRGTLIEQPGLLRRLRSVLEEAQSNAASAPAHRERP